MSLSPAVPQPLVHLIIGCITLLESGQNPLPSGFPCASATLTLPHSHPAAHYFNSLNIWLEYRIRSEHSLSWRIVVAGQPIGAAFEIPPSIWSHRDRALAVEASFVLAGIRLSLQKGFPIGLRARLSVVDRVERFDYVDLRSGEKVHGQPGMCKRLRNCKAALQHPYVCPVLLHRPGPNLCAAHR